MAYLDSNGLLYLWQKIKLLVSDKVDKENGKGLSTNDYTSAEKQKLAGIEAGATAFDMSDRMSKGDVNSVIFTGKLTAGAAPTASMDVTTKQYVDNAITTSLGNITSISFSVVNVLPASGEVGVIYLVAHSHDTDDGYDEYIWVNNTFEKLGHTDIDLSGYLPSSSVITNAEIDTIVATIN